jgi:hypothetical protein
MLLYGSFVLAKATWEQGKTLELKASSYSLNGYKFLVVSVKVMIKFSIPMVKLLN